MVYLYALLFPGNLYFFVSNFYFNVCSTASEYVAQLVINILFLIYSLYMLILPVLLLHSVRSGFGNSIRWNSFCFFLFSCPYPPTHTDNDIFYLILSVNLNIFYIFFSFTIDICVFI